MIYFYLFFSVIFILLQSFFVASEISFISSRLLKLRYRQERGDKRAGKVYRLLLEPEKFLTTVLIGVNLSVILSASFFTSFLIRLGINNSHFWTTVIFTPFIVIFAELIPKNIGRYFREDFSCRVVNLIVFFENLFASVIDAIGKLTRYLVKVLTGKTKLRSLFVTKEEIRFLLKEIEKGGGIDRGEKEAIEGVFELRSSTIKDVSLPLQKVAGLDYADSYQKIIEIIKDSRFTRYPVFKNREAVGYINVYDLFYNNGTVAKCFFLSFP